MVVKWAEMEPFHWTARPSWSYQHRLRLTDTAGPQCAHLGFPWLIYSCSSRMLKTISMFQARMRDFHHWHAAFCVFSDDRIVLFIEYLAFSPTNRIRSTNFYCIRNPCPNTAINISQGRIREWRVCESPFHSHHYFRFTKSCHPYLFLEYRVIFYIGKSDIGQ